MAIRSFLLGAILAAALAAAAWAQETPAALHRKALELLDQGRYAEALQVAEQALRRSEEVSGPESSSTAAVLYTLARAHSALEQHARALVLLERALRILEKTRGPESYEVAMVLGRLGQARRGLGDPLGAQPFLRRSAQILEGVRGPDHLDTVRAWRDLALALQEARQYTEALELYQKVVGLLEKTEGADPYELGIALGNMAALYKAMADYARAEPLYQRSLEILRRRLGAGHALVGTMLDNLGQLYREMGDYDKAEEAMRSALALFEGSLGPDSLDTAICVNNLAALYWVQERYQEAEPLYRRALEIWTRLGGEDHPQVGKILDNLAGVLRVTGRLQEAEDCYLRALALFEKRLGPEDLETALCRNNLAVLYADAGRSLEAEQQYRRALGVYERVLGPQHPEMLVVLFNLALVEIDLGKTAEAAALGQRAQEIREKVLADILSFTSEKERLAYQKSQKHSYTVLATLGLGPQMARALLRTKGIVLDSLVEDVRLAEGARSPELRRTVARLREAKARLVELAQKIPADTGSQALERRRTEIRQLEAEVEGLEKELARHVSGLGAPRRALAVQVQEVQERLPGDAVLVEFVKYRHYQPRRGFVLSYGAVVLRRSGPATWVALGPAEAIDTLVHRACRAATSRREGALAQVLRQAWAAVWQPLEPALGPGVSTVILSPDSELNFLSFATLLDPDGHLLAEKFDLRYVSSGRDLLLRTRPAGATDLVLVGDPDYSGQAGPSAPEAGGLESPRRSLAATDLALLEFAPLPGTARECQALADYARGQGWRVEALTRLQASEARLANLASPRILHLATHGFFLPEPAETSGQAGAEPSLNPMHRSGLALAGAQATVRAWRSGQAPPGRNDGILTAQEVGGLSLGGTWLVVLSACETGRGDAQVGEGVLGLRRGFAQAGAANLLMTLWPVDDATTAAFMLDFYRAVAADAKASAALARVQREWLTRLRQEQGLAAAVFLAGPFVLSFQGPP
jgi:tetratricopeptide (TPR) repeat protein/CHAT domain-containing protein